jgi:hypothetical protein
LRTQAQVHTVAKYYENNILFVPFNKSEAILLEMTEMLSKYSNKSNDKRLSVIFHLYFNGKNKYDHQLQYNIDTIT